MLDIERPVALTGGKSETLRVTSGLCAAALEIRSWLPEHRVGKASLRLEGHELSSEVGATVVTPFHILCLSPGEWLIVADQPLPSSTAQRLATELTAQGAVLIDSTDGLAVVTVRGSLARDVLSKGCGLDFDPQAFGVGRCARTRFAQMGVLVTHSDASEFRLYVARSYLRYLTDWLADAALEFKSSTL